MFRLFQLEEDMLSELLVVFPELQLLSSGKILLLDIRDIAHDSAFRRYA